MTPDNIQGTPFAMLSMREILLEFKHRFRDPKSHSIIMHRNAIAAKGTLVQLYMSSL